MGDKPKSCGYFMMSVALILALLLAVTCAAAHIHLQTESSHLDHHCHLCDTAPALQATVAFASFVLVVAVTPISVDYPAQKHFLHVFHRSFFIRPPPAPSQR